MRTGSICFAVCTLLSVSGCGYKSLQQQDEDVKTSWSEVVSQYQRRADLVSSLASSVKGFVAPCARTARSESDPGVASRPQPCDARVAPPEQALVGATEANARSSSVLAAPAVLKDPAAFASYEAMQDRLTQSLRSLMGVSAGYPQLQSDANFLDLRAQLAETEHQIADARIRYIEAVRTFNTTVRTFPTDVTARMFDFRPMPSLPSASQQ